MGGQRELARWADCCAARMPGRTRVVAGRWCTDGRHLHPALRAEVGLGDMAFVGWRQPPLHEEGHGAHYQQCQNSEHLLSPAVCRPLHAPRSLHYSTSSGSHWSKSRSSSANRD